MGGVRSSEACEMFGKACEMINACKKCPKKKPHPSKPGCFFLRNSMISGALFEGCACGERHALMVHLKQICLVIHFLTKDLDLDSS